MMTFNKLMRRAEDAARSDTSAVIGINFTKSGWEKRRGDRPRDGKRSQRKRNFCLKLSSDPAERERFILSTSNERRDTRTKP
jgi:hypothetical protein